MDSEGRQAVLAYAADVEKISTVMDELYALENELRDQQEQSSSNNSDGGGITNKSIELKASIKRLMTGQDVREALERLEVQGEPVWGLSAAEREMIVYAREKMNEC